MKKLLLSLVMILSVLQVKAQIPVTDVAANTNLMATVTALAQQLTTLMEQKKLLDESLDFMRKVNSTVTKAQIVIDLTERQGKLIKDCKEVTEHSKKFPGTVKTVSSNLEQIMTNSGRLLSLTTDVLSPTLKMSDAERLQMVDKISKELKEEEIKLYKTRQLVYEYERLDKMFE